jgi:hypothetical protein
MTRGDLESRRGGRRSSYAARVKAGGRRASVVIAIAVCSLALLPTGLAAHAGSGAPAGQPTRPKTLARDRAFLVAPAPYTSIGGPPTPRRTCRAAEVHATATARRSPDGVVTVVALTTKHTCDIHVGELHPTLYDAEGNRLGVPVVADADPVNPAENEGSAPFTTLGFAWDGSWCGASAATVAVPLTKGSVHTKLTGPQPRCTVSSAVTIVPGAFGYPGEPVQGAPPEWRFLIVSFHVPAVTRSPGFVHPYLRFTNSSDQPVVLGPTPTYEIGVHDKYGDGTDGEGERTLPLHAGARTVAAQGSLRVDLPTQSIVEDYRDLRGKRVTATFAMAGVPTASTTSELDHAALNSYEGHCRLNGSTVPTFTTQGNKECVSLKWRFAVKPSPARHVLHLRWHGYCVSRHASVNKRQTRHSVVIAVTNIERTQARCAVVRGRVSLRLGSRLGRRHIHHAATRP